MKKYLFGALLLILSLVCAVEAFGQPILKSMDVTKVQDGVIYLEISGYFPSLGYEYTGYKIVNNDNVYIINLLDKNSGMFFGGMITPFLDNIVVECKDNNCLGKNSHIICESGDGKLFHQEINLK